jgi:CDP-6-deoxy-D-xylo-4-hexulose-3-dehydrase
MEIIIVKSNFNWQLINDSITEGDREALVEFIKTSNRWTNGPKVKEFEDKWSEWLEIKHSVFVNSGAMANYLMVALMKETKGLGEVIVPAIGWVSDVSSLINLGMKPVFVDVKVNNFAMTVESIKNAVTEKTKGIVLCHILGFNAIDQQIIDFAKQNDLFLIEDCCESHGVTYKGKKAGTFGDVSNFSFYFGHHITSIEGGMVCTNDDELYELCRMYRSHGFTREASVETQQKYIKEYPDVNPLFTFAVPGFNMRSTELNAVLGIEQLKRLNYNIWRRQENLRVWISCLDSIKYRVDFKEEGSSNFALPLIVQDSNKELFKKVCNYLSDARVEYRVGTAGGGNQARQPYLRKYNYTIAEELVNADYVHDFGLYVGNHPELDIEQIIDLCDRLNLL